MLNDALDGKSWKEHKVKKSQIYSRNAKTMEGSEKIWEYMKDLVQKNIDRGNIQDEWRGDYRLEEMLRERFQLSRDRIEEVRTEERIQEP